MVSAQWVESRMHLVKSPEEGSMILFIRSVLCGGAMDGGRSSIEHTGEGFPSEAFAITLHLDSSSLLTCEQ